MLEQRFIDLYDQYTHSSMPRREFLDKLTVMAGGAALLSILPLLEINTAQAAIVADNDARLTAETITYSVAKEKASGYLVYPKGKVLKDLAVVIVIHENKGLVPHIKDVARRTALEGFAAFAPDVLSAGGGTPEDPEKAKEMIGKLDPALSLEIFKSAVAHMAKSSAGKTGSMGFCWGGAMANNLAIHAEKLRAAVAFYGKQPSIDDTAKIHAPLLLHYAGTDERINAGIKDFEAALKKQKKPYELYMYEGAQHAFHNDTAGDRYNKAAADIAWKRSMSFLKKYL